MELRCSENSSENYISFSRLSMSTESHSLKKELSDVLEKISAIRADIEGDQSQSDYEEQIKHPDVCPEKYGVDFIPAGDINIITNRGSMTPIYGEISLMKSRPNTFTSDVVLKSLLELRIYRDWSARSTNRISVLQPLRRGSSDPANGFRAAIINP